MIAKLLAGFKNWLYAGLLGLVAFLYVLLNFAEKKRDKARQERDIARSNAKQQQQRADDQVDLSKAQQEARQKAKDHADKQTPADSRPTGKFGDSRLSDDD